MTALVRYEALKTALAEALTIDEVKDIRDKAEAMRAYARMAKDEQLELDAAEYRVLAERRLGELLVAQREAGLLAKGARGNPGGQGAKIVRVADGPTQITLAEAGIDKHLADRARRLAAMPDELFKAGIQRVRDRISTGKRASLDIAAVDKQERRSIRERALAAMQRALPTRRYGVILADPEWRFQPYSRATGMDRAADNHYPTSATDEIAARDVPSIAAPDCVLFLWATAPMLPDALRVMAAWGFTYRSHIIWRKDRVGTGYWFRNMHELLLVGTRGNVPAPAPGTQARSIFDAPVAEHSRKPDATYELIEAYFPHLPKIELNARARRPGWDAWGNEAPAEESNQCTDSIHRTDSVPPHPQPQPQPEKDAGENQCAGSPQPREDQSSHDMSPGVADDLDIPAFLDRRKWAGAGA